MRALAASNNPYGIIPPHLLNRVIQRGNEQQRRRALTTLNLDDGFRGHAARRQADTMHESHAPDDGDSPQRHIFDARHGMQLPGEEVRSEGESETGDREVNEAYEDLGATWRFFHEVFGRDSIDNAGMALLGTVHYGHEYQNAFWNGQQMVFGDGDGEIFLPFTRALDVVAHELAHGVTEIAVGLAYANQSGALNESVSDVFGVMTKQYAAQQTAEEADWLIGAELLAEGVQGRALRSMAEPGSAYDDPVLGRDPQPGHMDQYVETEEDNGGVHINSGIPNHAFYLIATALGGYSWERAGHVWYDTLLDERLTRGPLRV
ncbi:protealysin propeptide [Kushneria sinocarnis]|uniref:Neutral metalloproteinase n=1 Tax=Kushneria sinocarnis TaxID=595502 RepID=A0A420WTF3_9GAMM|nr:M4 family metallopeptidase [Kushneria sinocarnis]RKQ96284.1 protealysin propeptide [Kushneria sinocarnis]